MQERGIHQKRKRRQSTHNGKPFNDFLVKMLPRFSEKGVCGVGGVGGLHKILFLEPLLIFFPPERFRPPEAIFSPLKKQRIFSPKTYCGLAFPDCGGGQFAEMDNFLVLVKIHVR